MIARIQAVAQGVATALAAGFPDATVERVYDNQVDVDQIPDATAGMLFSVIGKEETSERVSRGELLDTTTVDVGIRARVGKADLAQCDPLAVMVDDVADYFWKATWPGSKHTLKQPTITLPWSIDEVRSSGLFVAVVTLQFESVRAIPVRAGGVSP